jgi:hypothetical protein
LSSIIVCAKILKNLACSIFTFFVRIVFFPFFFSVKE